MLCRIISILKFYTPYLFNHLKSVTVVDMHTEFNLANVYVICAVMFIPITTHNTDVINKFLLAIQYTHANDMHA